jgi:phage tail sheath protein FI
MVRREQEAIWVPPDGPVCGQLAAGALERGAWIAVANRPLRDCVALSPPGLRPSLADRQQLLDAQVNLLRSAPIGFVVSSSDTLAPEPDWRPINVRRLMCLLRRLALQRGQTYVFEPNGAVLRRTVERGFEAVLDQLFRRGALAGTTPERAYQINVGPDINSRQRRDAGQFWVELKVAPSLPMSFLTVRLMRSGERVVSQEAH